MFDNIAPTYDRANHLLSMQIDRLWRRRVVSLVRHFLKGSPAPKILDCATGTADLAIAMARAVPHARIVGVDPSRGMLSVAAEKVEREGISARTELECQSAEELSFVDGAFDVVTASFGVRNYSDLRGGLGEMIRVVRCGGMVVILEFSTPTNPLFSPLYTLYSRHILPRIGAMLSKDREAYDYLPASVEEFSTPSQMTSLLGELGLVECRARSLSFGIAQIYTGIKR